MLQIVMTFLKDPVSYTKFKKDQKSYQALSIYSAENPHKTKCKLNNAGLSKGGPRFNTNEYI